MLEYIQNLLDSNTDFKVDWYKRHYIVLACDNLGIVLKNDHDETKVILVPWSNGNTLRILFDL